MSSIHSEPDQSRPATVFFARCPPVTTDDQVREVFSAFGEIEEINLYRRWQSAKTSKGCGFVRFKKHAAAAAALEALNGKFMFEISEAPMVVEWIDPARLVTRQQTAGSKQSSINKTRRSDKEQLGDNIPHPCRQQTFPTSYVVHPMSRPLLDQSRMVNSQISPCSSSIGQCIAATFGPLLSPVQDQMVHGSLPAHMMQTQPNHKLPTPALAVSRIQALQHATHVANAVASAGTPAALASPISLMHTYQPWVSQAAETLPAQLGMVLDETNIPVYIPLNSSRDASNSQTLTGLSSAQATVSQSTIPTSVGSIVQSTAGAPHVICFDEVAAVSSSLPYQSGEHLSGLCTASGPWVTSCASAAVLSGSTGCAPIYSGVAASDGVSSFSHPLIKVCRSGISGCDTSAANAGDVGALQQLQALSGSHPAAMGSCGSGMNLALQPAMAGIGSNTIMGSAQAQELTLNPRVVLQNMESAVNRTPQESSQARATIAIEADSTADIITNMELLNKVSGAQVALVADGHGVQLHIAGKLAAVGAAYQMLCLLCPGKQLVLGDLLVAQD